MSALGYVVTLLPDLPEPLRLTRIGGGEERDLEVRGPTLIDAADAILADHAGRRFLLPDVMAFSAMAFSGLGERGALAITVKGDQVARFCDAARRVA